MNLDEMIEYLQDLREVMPGSTPVVAALQPSWAKQAELRNVAAADGVVYLDAGGHEEYLPSAGAEALGW